MDFFTDHFKGVDNLKIYFAPIDEEDCVVKNIGHEFSDYDEHPYISLIKFGRKNGLYRGFPDMEDEEGLDHDEHGLLKKLKIYPGVTNCYATCPSVYSVDANGLIYKCHRLLGRTEHSSGNVFEGIVENDAYHFFCNTDPTYKECDDCAIMPICQGGCKVNAMLYHGHEACAPSKAIIKELILLYQRRHRQCKYGKEESMSIIKEVSKEEMMKSLTNEATQDFAACSDDCPKCRVSDG